MRQLSQTGWLGWRGDAYVNHRPFTRYDMQAKDKSTGVTPKYLDALINPKWSGLNLDISIAGVWIDGFLYF
jgi:hypothetical protein